MNRGLDRWRSALCGPLLVLLALLALLAGSLAGQGAATAHAATQPAEPQPTPEERLELPPAAIEELKRRAQAVIERRAAGRPTLSGYASVIGAYESNPNLSTPRKGDLYTEEDAGLAVR